jgi:hypothetical protein
MVPVNDPIVLWIPRPPDNANSRAHYGAALVVKRRYLRELDTRLAAKLLPAPPATPVARAQLESHWWTQGRSRHLDPDNATRRLKPVIDWLVSRGYLAGDTQERLAWVQPVQFRQHLPIEAPTLSSVRITITPKP